MDDYYNWAADTFFESPSILGPIKLESVNVYMSLFTYLTRVNLSQNRRDDYGCEGRWPKLRLIYFGM